MKVRWTRAAQHQLREIVSVIARDSPLAASKVAEKIHATTDRIGRQPLAGPMVPEIGDPVIRERRAKPFRILYSVASEPPKILAIYHQRRRLPIDS